MICLRAGRWQHTWTWTDDSTEGKWKIMFFSFDYVIKEMVNVAAVQPWSYGCTWVVCLALKKLESHYGCTPARLPFLKYEGLILKRLKVECFWRFVKHRSIVDLQQTLKYVRFTKIQHTFKRWAIYEDRIAELSKRLKDERRGHTNHHVG